ncbi:MAG: flagellar protein FlgN [Sphingobacteriia bacterium]|nr:flagellar protein FlgN [Sphingobacteriia bacterium]NCC38988.1 flagellar protein FlgN [Gammaproteobacteria bacterium]
MAESTLARLLADQRAAFETLVTVLDREQQHLIAGDAERLPALTEEKNARFHALQRLHEDILAHCGQAGLDAGGAALRALIHDQPMALDDWDATLRLARLARDLNARNGVIVQERMVVGEAALAVLAGKDAEPQTYDAGGQTRPGKVSRSLGRA